MDLHKAIAWQSYSVVRNKLSTGHVRVFLFPVPVDEQRVLAASQIEAPTLLRGVV